jgi:predicted dehydrogenase
METTKIGLIGCGTISAAYLKIAADWYILEVDAVADLYPEKARERAEEFDIRRVMTVEGLLADDDIDIVVNLTIPNAHYQVALAALEAGKAVYNEKPLTIDRSEGAALVEKARTSGCLLGGAPDTFLGGGIQTCRKLIDDGWIGEPVAASAFMMGHGHESWHPDPAFYYKIGGGPMFDMGPYYLTALVNLLGPVARVTGMARKTFTQRTITSEPKHGEIIDVEVPTHVAGVMEFASGAIGTITTSFDVWGGRLPFIEIYGTEGSLAVPNPNTFGGPVLIKGGTRGGDWQEVPLSHPNSENSRSIGVADMAYALRSGRAHRANGELTYHVLDLMHAFHEAQQNAGFVELGSTCERPAALPVGLAPGHLEL